MTDAIPPDATAATAGQPALPRTAVVTGAGRGIGRGLALGLAAAGHAVALLGRTPGHLEAVAQEVADAGGSAVVVPVDVVDRAAVRAAAEHVERALGGVGLLVNNAGVVEEREVPFADDDPDDAWRVIETNVRGPMLVTHAFLPGMLARGGGRVVSINSGAAYRAGTAYTGYGVSKGALARFTATVAAQYRDAGVRAFDLAPGVVPTDMTAGMPVHGGRTQWTPVEASVELLVGIADGALDRLSGRFLRAGEDTVAELVARTDEILAADARCLRLVTWGETDPLRP